MANTIAGMFADPSSFRDERINDLMKQRQAISNMGGSMNQLLGQVAAGGGATGAMMAEGLGGMFGLSTREEQKAAELQAMAENMDLETSSGLAEFAKMLNGLGYTKEAIQVLEKRDSVLDRERDEADRQRKIKQGRVRERSENIKQIRLDSKGNPILMPNGMPLMETKTVKYEEEWDEATGTWKRVADKKQTNSGYLADWAKLLVPATEQKTQPESKPTASQKDGSGYDYSHWGY